ncbi:hypothetical protein EJ06DRAFT_304967, partial [Trichodelitschia bisporula]
MAWRCAMALPSPKSVRCMNWCIRKILSIWAHPKHGTSELKVYEKKRPMQLFHVCTQKRNEGQASFLFATNKKAMEEALAWAWERDDKDEVEGFSDRLHAHLLEAHDPSLPVSFRREAGWRSIGTLGKVHNLAVFIRSSPQISDAWGELAHESLGIDNETRWNSWFYLLEKVQKHQGHLFTFCREYSSNQ